jgi:hypothetical protein
LIPKLCLILELAQALDYGKFMVYGKNKQTLETNGSRMIRAAREHFNLEKCVGVDISEHMLRMAEDLIESKQLAEWCMSLSKLQRNFLNHVFIESGNNDYAENTTFQRYFSYNPKVSSSIPELTVSYVLVG